MFTTSVLDGTVMVPPPPLRLAVVDNVGAELLTATTSAIAVVVFEGIGTERVHVTFKPPGAVHDQLSPPPETKVNPAGKTSVTVTVPVVATPALVMEMV